MVRSRTALVLIVLSVLWGADCRPGGADEATEEGDAAVARALAELEAPAERTRRAALARLARALPEALGAVQAAFPDAPPRTRPLLADLLVRDASPASIRLLLRELKTGQEDLAVQILLALARSEPAAQVVRDLFALEPDLRTTGGGADVHPRVADLESLLERALVERLFLSRKSNSGMTGAYRGQYDVLKPHRQSALEFALAILKDEAMPIPGVYTAGPFAFLRAPRRPVEFGELLGMAAHAFAELALPSDTPTLLRAHTLLMRLEREMRNSRLDENSRIEAILRYGDLLTALYRVRPERYVDLVDDHLRELEYGSIRRVLPRPRASRAAMLLRVGRYEDAVDSYREALDYDFTSSKAGTNYNLACAYAQWALQEDSPAMREYRLGQALEHLEIAADERWSDIAWMDEDRDLEPIRDTARYQALRERVRREITPPGHR